MYTIMLIRDSKTDEDAAYDGLLRIRMAGTESQVRDIIREEALEQHHLDYKNNLINGYHIGNFEFVILKDGCPIEYPGSVDSIDIEVYGDDYSESFDIRKDVSHSAKQFDYFRKFVAELKEEELVCKSEFMKEFQKQVEIEIEKQTLRKLLGKYPEMKNGS